MKDKTIHEHYLQCVSPTAATYPCPAGAAASLLSSFPRLSLTHVAWGHQSPGQLGHRLKRPAPQGSASKPREGKLIF